MHKMMKSNAHFLPQIESQARASLPVVSADVLLPCQKSRADILERRDTSDKDTGARRAAALPSPGSAVTPLTVE